MNVVAVVLAAVLGAGAAGCSGVASSPVPSQKPPWTATFEQDRPDQASRNAHVKLTSDRPRDVTVDGVRLRWPGYGAVAGGRPT